jgi:carbonic anhydrase
MALSHDPVHVISAEEALQRLKEGNERFMRGKAHVQAHPSEAFTSFAEGQHPFATILGCSDSRVPPEWVFNTGLGELFVIRVAGNVLAPDVAASLQYAGVHLHIPLLVVMGHERCGAIEAALASKYEDVQQLSRIQLLVDSILPAMEGIDPQLPAHERLARAVENNVRWTVRAITDTPEVQARLKEGRTKIVGAIYELRTGRVRFLD